MQPYNYKMKTNNDEPVVDPYIETQKEEGALSSVGVNQQEDYTVKGATIPKMPTQETKQTAPYDPYTFSGQAKEDVAGVYDPLIKGAETMKGAVDIGAEQEIEGIYKAIPYVTRQFEAYQAKAGLGTGMQMRQSNELIMDIAETVGNVYDKATLQKLGIDSQISEYQSAMAAGELERATELYSQAQSQALLADQMGFGYVQPEVAYMYDQMSASQSIMDSLDATEAEKTSAQDTYNSLTKALKDLGYTGEIGEGLKTYQAYQREVERYMLEMQDYLASETYDVEMYSNSHTFLALQEMYIEGLSWDEAKAKYSYADIDIIVDIQGKITSGELSADMWKQAFSDILEERDSSGEETP